jgi:hypothetical protein
VTEATAQWVEKLIWADRRITSQCSNCTEVSHGLAYSIMHDHLKFQKVWARWVPRELKDREKWTQWVCPCSISYSVHMKEKICLTELLLEMNHGCITTNMNKSVLHCNGNIPVNFQPKSSRLQVRQQLGRLCLLCFGILRVYC